MPNSNNAILLMYELLAMPEHQLAIALEELHISIEIFEGNYHDLEALITFLTTDPRADHLLYITNSDKLKSILINSIRLLHNFAAAALSLIDHTRRLKGRLFDDTSFPDYQPTIQSTFAQDPLSQFVKDLRIYCQHYKAPNLGINVRSAGNTDPGGKTIVLRMEDLRSFGARSPQARTYLGTAGDHVDILRLATAYRHKVLNFYEWLESRVREIYAEEFKRYHQKENDYILARLDMETQMASASRRQGSASTTESALATALSSEEIEELRHVPICSDQRATHAIRLLERKLSIPAEIQKRIIDLYREESRSSHSHPATNTDE